MDSWRQEMEGAGGWETEGRRCHVADGKQDAECGDERQEVEDER